MISARRILSVLILLLPLSAFARDQEVYDLTYAYAMRSGNDTVTGLGYDDTQAKAFAETVAQMPDGRAYLSLHREVMRFFGWEKIGSFRPAAEVAGVATQLVDKLVTRPDAGAVWRAYRLAYAQARGAGKPLYAALGAANATLKPAPPVAAPPPPPVAAPAPLPPKPGLPLHEVERRARRFAKNEERGLGLDDRSDIQYFVDEVMNANNPEKYLRGYRLGWNHATEIGLDYYDASTHAEQVARRSAPKAYIERFDKGMEYFNDELGYYDPYPFAYSIAKRKDGTKYIARHRYAVARAMKPVSQGGGYYDDLAANDHADAIYELPISQYLAGLNEPYSEVYASPEYWEAIREGGEENLNPNPDIKFPRCLRSLAVIGVAVPIVAGGGAILYRFSPDFRDAVDQTTAEIHQDWEDFKDSLRGGLDDLRQSLR